MNTATIVDRGRVGKTDAEETKDADVGQGA